MIPAALFAILAGAAAAVVFSVRSVPMNYAHESIPRWLEKLAERGACYCSYSLPNPADPKQENEVREVVHFLAEDSSPRALWFLDHRGDEHCVPLWVGGFEVLDALRFRVCKFGQWITFDLSARIPKGKGARNG